MKKIANKLHYNPARRRFIKQTAMAGTIVGMGLSPTAQAIGGLLPPGRKVVMTNPLGFNGERCDPVTGGYHLGNGYRMYNPRLMRFHGADSMSPFGKGGLNSYAYCLGDPINKRDPSGHFALIDNLIGAVVGFVVGLISQGIQTLMDPSHEIDWAQIGIDAAVGFLTSGFGVGSSVLLETVVGGVVDFGANFALNVGRGQSLKEAAKSAGISAGVGVAIGLGGIAAKGGTKQVARAVKNSVASKRLAKIQVLYESGKPKGQAIMGSGTHLIHTFDANPGFGGYHTKVFLDSTKGGKSRVNLVMHGSTGSVGSMAGSAYNGSNVVNFMRNVVNNNTGTTFDQIDRIRLLVCHSADSNFNAPSLAAQVAAIANKPTKGFHGPVLFDFNTYRPVKTLSECARENRSNFHYYLPETFESGPVFAWRPWL